MKPRNRGVLIKTGPLREDNSETETFTCGHCGHCGPIRDDFPSENNPAGIPRPFSAHSLCKCCSKLICRRPACNVECTDWMRQIEASVKGHRAS